MRRAVRAIRHATSPRLAIRIFENIGERASQRDVVVLLPRVLQALLPQHGESAAEAATGAVGHDHVVDEAARARNEGIGELLAIFVGARLDLGGVADVTAED